MINNTNSKKTKQPVSIFKKDNASTRPVQKVTQPIEKYKEINETNDVEIENIVNKLIELNNNNDNSNGNQGKFFKTPYDEKFRQEIEKDFSNNKLLDRMNSELNFRVYGHRDKTFDKPYLDGQNLFANDEFEDNNKEQIQQKPQINKRILGQRKYIK